jgi:hypothetical protein
VRLLPVTPRARSNKQPFCPCLVLYPLVVTARFSCRLRNNSQRYDKDTGLRYIPIESWANHIALMLLSGFEKGILPLRPMDLVALVDKRRWLQEWSMS